MLIQFEDFCHLYGCLYFYLLQVPDITVDKVMVYLELFGQEVRKNAKEMYFAKFLRNIRISTVGNDVFILGRVSAEMIKNCIYKVDLQIDHMGVVQERASVNVSQEWGLRHIASMWCWLCLL
jgi:hypothetical protein